MATYFIKRFLVLGSVHSSISFNLYSEMTQVLSLFYTGKKITFMLNNVLRVTQQQSSRFELSHSDLKATLLTSRFFPFRF